MKRLEHLYIGLILLIFILAACDHLKEDFNIQPLTNPVKIGVIGDVTIGREAAENVFFAIKMAADEINSTGGLTIHNENREIELIFKNSGGDPELGKTVIDELIAEDVDIILGPTISAVALDMANKCIENDILMMGYSTTSPELSYLNDRNLIWRTCPSDASSGSMMAQYAFDSLEQKSAAILYRNDKFGIAMNDIITYEYNLLGGEIIASANFPTNETELNLYDYSHEINKLLEFEPQIIFAPVFELEIGKITQDLWASTLYQNMNVKPKIFLTEGGFAQELITNGQPNIIENIFGISSSVTTNPNYQAFKNNYIQKYHFEPITYAEHGYDGLYAIAYAMVRAQSIVPQDIKQNLRQVTNGVGLNDNPVKININEFERAKTLLLSGIEIDYQGASGSISFDENGDPKSQFVIWKIIDKKYTEISYMQK